jgi:energy-coupling factor transport system ATP-binding protein
MYILWGGVVMGSNIETKSLTYWYGQDKEVPVLKDISLAINKGEFVAVVGANGCGKSTLVRHFNGLLVPCTGSVHIDGLDTGDIRHIPVIRRKVGMVFQNPDNQLFASVVEEDVAFGLENMCLPRAEIRERVEHALATVGMSEYRDYPAHRLSGGQKQKVAIAGILAMEPQYLIMDEPTSMLDPAGKKEVFCAVRVLNRQQNITVVYVTHDMTEVLFCSRLIALAEGKIVFSGNSKDFFSDREYIFKCGLALPPIKDLVDQLIKEGLPIPRSVNSAEELVNILC